MGTKIIIELKSETVYSDEEVKQLTLGFGDFMNEFDDDADPNTIKVQAHDENSDAANRYTAAEFVEMVENGSASVIVTIAPDGGQPFALRLNNDDA